MRGAIRLVAVDARAAAVGLAPGLSLADARSRVPELVVADHDATADLALLDRLADRCLRFTPQVELDPPDGLVLDISGCAHLFGGEAQLADQLVARLTRSGLAVRHAVGPTPDAARAFARFATPPAPDEAAAILRLPVAALRLDPDATVALTRAGLKTVGDIVRRPTAMVAARFGAEAVAALARLTGGVDTPLTPHRAPPAISAERRFAEPVASTAYVLEVAAALAGEVARQMEARDRGGRRFELLLFRSDGALRRLDVETGHATRDPQAMMRLIRERIDSLDDPLDPGFGYDLVRFDVPRVEPLAAVQLKLEGGAVADAEVAALIDRLSTRLGRGRVRRFVPVDSHIPEQAQLMLPAVDAVEPKPWTAPDPGEPPLRPLHLFDPPQPIDVIAGVPDGPPQRFRWRRGVHDVARSEGPERIAPQWWRRRDGKGLTRDYYRIEDMRGRRYWIFRHGLYGDEKPDPGWYLHGVFA